MTDIQVFELFATIGLKADEFNKGIDSAVAKGTDSGSKLGSILKGVGKAAVVGLAAAGTAFVGLATKALNLGGDLEQSLGGIETLFKGSADIVIANAENAYKTAGLNANDYMQQVTSFSASLLQSLGGDTEAVAKVADMAVIDMADNANKMGSSMESIQNAYSGFAKSNYTMLDNLKLGYGGTKKEMERLLVDAQKLSGVKYDISNLSDVYEAIHVIQTELDITGTTAKEGMETLSGSVATAKAAFANFLSGAGDVDAVTDSVINLGHIVADRLGELIPRLVIGLKGIFTDLVTEIGMSVPALQPLSNAIVFLAENFDAVLAVLVPLIAATAAYKAIVAISGIITLVTKALNGMTIAQYALNAAMTANPVGIVIAGAIALGIGLGTLLKHLNKNAEGQKALKKSTDDLTVSHGRLLDSMGNSQSAYNDNMTSIIAEAGAAKKLSNTIYELAANENKSGEDKLRLLTYTSMLNEAMGETVLAYNAETDALSRTQVEIEGLIASRMEQARAVAAQERAVEIAKEQLLIEEQLAGIARTRAETSSWLNENTTEYAAVMDKLNQQESELVAKNGALTASFEHVVGVQVEAKAATEDTTDAFDKQSAIMEASTEAQEKALQSLASEYQSYADKATDMFNTLSDKSTLTVGQMTANMEENQRVISTWADNIAILAERGLDAGLLEEIRAAGPEAAGLAATLVEATDEELAKLNEVFTNGGDTAKEALATSLGLNAEVVDAAANLAKSTSNSLLQELEAANFSGMGGNVAQGLANGIAENAHKAITAAENMALAVAARVKAAMVISSPSKLFRDEIGAQLPAGMAEGIKATTPQAIKAAEKMAKDTYAAAKTWIEDYRNDEDYLAAQELEMWEYLASVYTDVSKEKVEIDKNIAKLRQKIQKDEFDHSKNWIDKRKKYGMLSMQEEVEAWERVQSRYLEGSEEREEADRSLYESRARLLSEQKDIIEQITDVEKNYSDAVDSRAQAIFNTFGLFDELKDKVKVSGYDLKDNLRDQVEEMRDWSDNIRELSERGIDDGLMAELRKMGPAANAEIAALVRMSDASLSDYSDLWGEKQAIAREMAIEELQELRSEADAEIAELANDMEELFAPAGETAGEGWVQKLIDGMDNKTAELLDKVRGLGVMMNDELGDVSGDVSATIIPSGSGFMAASASPIAESRSISEIVFEAIAQGFAMVSDTILGALPEVLQFSIDSTLAGEALFDGTDRAAKRRGTMGFPTREAIIAIARTILPPTPATP